MILNAGMLVLTFGFPMFAGIVFLKFVAHNLHILVIAGFLSAAVYSAILKLGGTDIADESGENSDSIMLAEQEANEIHEDLLTLMYNVVAETSEHTPIARPRDVYSIETSREKQYWMDGSMAVHQFEVDCDTKMDRDTRDKLIRELQRHTNQQSRRYPGLVRDGHPPIVYDIKPNGNFLLLEIVLYSANQIKKIEARKRVRIERQYGQERIDDPRYK